ncbi:hypothetical protein F4803DRAFT_552090 [Xylaria telfairii]|nr:hypothetical protein F4803DRAFT_552090 [Xylaria telfairii]
MDSLKQDIATIDSAIIEARQWLSEAQTDRDTQERQAELATLEADLVAQQARLDEMILAREMSER